MNPSQDNQTPVDAAANVEASKALALSTATRETLVKMIGTGDKVEEVHVKGITPLDAIAVAKFCVDSGHTVPKFLAKVCENTALRKLRKTHKAFLKERTPSLFAAIQESNAHIDAMGAWKRQKSGDEVQTIRLRKPAVKTIQFKTPEEAKLAVAAGLRKAHFDDEARAELCRLLGGTFNGKPEASDKNAIDVDTNTDPQKQLAPATEM